MKSTNLHKTRFAPTPSGFLHLGNIYSFAVTSALAKKYGAGMLLRIDDVDRDRTDSAFIHDIFDSLNFLGIPWDDGPKNVTEFDKSFSQQHRMALYHEVLNRLRNNGVLFACHCSRSEVIKHSTDGGYAGTCRDLGLSFDAPGVAWRMDTKNAGVITLNTIGAHYTSTLPAEVRDFIVRKRDGFPAYHLTSVVDDNLYGIDLVVRGMDLLPSSQAQVFLAEHAGFSGFKNAIFHHHALFLDPDGEKLSKSGGATSVHYLREQGLNAGEILSGVAELAGFNVRVENWEGLVSVVSSERF